VTSIAGIVLAAGLSRRLGRPKQLLVLDDRALVAHVADRALASTLDEVIVVTGASAAEIREAIGDRTVRFVHNPDFERGQGTSLAAGIAALGEAVDATVILLGDQPGIAPETIDRVIGARRETIAPVIMARYGDQQGHPVLFGREVFTDLMRLDGDTGGREIVRAHREALVLVDGGADAPPPDVDTEEAWDALRRGWKTD